ncbi:polygalacturonase inhibitor 1-like [Silene latifolia]|uniref:polygalacturonase inhibitor 1-like n=1 Tax=Silene latifolia TaxID=37657 RepID=UPI003D78731F
METQLKFSLFLTSLIVFSCLLSYSSSAELCDPKDKTALLQIKNRLGPNTTFFESWQPNTDCCKSWINVGCDDKTNRVKILTIGQNNELEGQIPPVVGDLIGLEQLWFNDMPGLTGPIPTSLSNLINLQELALARTNITGSIPPFLGRLKKLTTLDLSENRLSGPIPPSLSLLTNLQQLLLFKNQLIGSIPASFGSFKSLVLIQAYENLLTGPIPNSLSKVDLTWLDLSNNNLTGDASFLFGSNQKLILLNLSKNALSFDLSKVVFPKKLQGLDLSHNMIYGSLPKQLAQLPLELFNVSYNQLCGPIPTGNWLNKFKADSFAFNKCLCGGPLAACT